MFISFDIETGPLPLKKREFCRPEPDDISYGNLKDEAKRKIKYEAALKEWVDEGNALDETQSQIVAIGWHTQDDGLQLRYAVDGMTEAKLLKEFWALCPKKDATLAGHYIATFDLPFMIRRSMVLNVKFPMWVAAGIDGYRPDPELIFDTRLMWTFGNKNEHIKLKKLAAFCGYKCKTGDVAGKDFWKYLRDGKMKECDEYLGDDVMAVKAIFDKLWA